jgi:hypothetical protein
VQAVPETAWQPPAWRIEINRRARSGKGHTYHWIWRLTFADGRRRSRYGGSLASLPNPRRWRKYKRNSRRAARREKENQNG